MFTSALRADAVQLLLQALDVVGDLRAHVRVHARGQRALVLAELGQHLGRERHREARVEALDDLADLALVRAVHVRVDQRDRQRLDAGLDEVAHDRLDLLLVDGHDRVSPRASIRSTASRVSASEAGGSGLIMMIQPASGPGVCERARCRICWKPWRRDQADAGALRLEHRVRRDRRPVQDVPEVADVDRRPRRRSA